MRVASVFFSHLVGARGPEGGVWVDACVLDVVKVPGHPRPVCVFLPRSE